MEIGFLFDNDGVLIDSQEFHWRAWQWLMKEENRFFMDERQFLEGFGKRNDLIIREMVPGITQEELNRIAKKKEELFRKAAKENIKLLDGTEKFLQSLVAATIPRIIASSTPVENLRMFLHSTVLGKYFDAFVSSEEVPKGKPAPDVFIEAARRLHLLPNQCIVVEDAPVGIRAGKEAGCFVVAVATTHPMESLNEADLIYPTPRDLNLSQILEKRKK
jgi:HAD superfamily hydrolase (TIGR01509 family)